jgi:hypothetical protein
MESDSFENILYVYKMWKDGDSFAKEFAVEEIKTQVKLLGNTKIPSNIMLLIKEMTATQPIGLKMADKVYDDMMFNNDLIVVEIGKKVSHLKGVANVMYETIKDSTSELEKLDQEIDGVNYRVQIANKKVGEIHQNRKGCCLWRWFCS